MGPSKVLETRSEADVVWLEAKPDCGFKVLGSSLAAEVYPADTTSPDGDWLSKVYFKFFGEAKDGVIAAVVRRGKEYYPFFIGVKSSAGQSKAVLDKVWASPVSRFGAIDVFDDGFCALKVRNEAGKICSTYSAAAESAYIPDGDLLCRYLLGLADDSDLLVGIKVPLAVFQLPERRLIITLWAGQKDAETVESQEPRAEERKTLKARLAEQEERIAELEAETERQEKLAIEREEVITSLIAEIKNCQAASAKDREEMEGMRAELEVLRQILAEREAAIAELEAQEFALKKERNALYETLAQKETFIAEMSPQKQELIDAAIKRGNQLGEIAWNWERAARALKEVIAGSLLFKHFPSVREALDKFPLEKEV